MNSEKYIGEAPLKESPKKKLSLIVRDGSITNTKLKDSAVTGNKIAQSTIEESNLSEIVREKLNACGLFWDDENEEE